MIIQEDQKKVDQVKEAGKFIAHTTHLTEGLSAPYFEGKNQNGELIKLTDFKKKKLLVYFYPKDNTPACTAEACSLRDCYVALSDQGIAVVGISSDSEKSHLKFSQKQSLPFSLLADTDLKIIKSYDVWGEKMLYGRVYMGLVRTSFLIDEKGVIKKVIRLVDTKNHAQQVLSFI